MWIWLNRGRINAESNGELRMLKSSDDPVQFGFTTTLVSV